MRLSVSTKTFFFFSSRRRHTRSKRDWIQTCALPISRRLLADQGPERAERLCMAVRVGRRRSRGHRAAARPRGPGDGERSEERRVGKECGARWGQEHEGKKRGAWEALGRRREKRDAAV